MARERGDQVDILNDQFKNMVFANNPELYQELFKDELGPEDKDVDWFVPETPDQVEDVLAELREAGLVR